MNLFERPKQSYYKVGDKVFYYSPTINELREYIVSKVYTNFRNTKQIAYKLTVLNQNNRYWAVVLEKQLIKKSTG